MTGAEMVIRALKDQGVTHIFGYPGGAVLPIYDALFKAERHHPCAGAPRAGRRPCRRRLCPLHRQARRGAGDLRSRRHQCRHRPDRCADGFHSAGGAHRPGADASDRHRRLPGMRHGRHHPALHQAQLAGEGRRTICRACCTRPSRSPPPAAPARWWSTFPRTSSSRPAPITARSRSITAPTGPRPIRTWRAIVQAVEMMAAAKRPIFYTGGGIINSGPEASQAAARAGGPDRLSRHLDPDGPGRLSGLASANGWACWACTAPGKPITPCMIAT